MKKKLISIFLFLICLILYSQSQTPSQRSADKLVYDNKNQIFTYTGNSRFENKDTKITSHTMKFFQKEEIATFNTGVKLLNKEFGETITSGLANYNGKTRFAWVKINPILTSPTNNLTIRSLYMERDFNTPYAKALTNVRLKHIDKENKKITDGFSKEIIYNVETQISIMSGDPILIQGNDKLEGEILEYDSKNSTANVMGGSKIYILQTNNYSNTNEVGEKISNYNIVTADRLFMDSKGGEYKTNRMLYGYGNVTAYFNEENMILKGDYLIYDMDKYHMFMYDTPSVRIPDKGVMVFSQWLEYKKADEFKDVIFHDKVIMIDYNDNISLEGNLLHLDPDTKIATMSGEPYAYLENRKYKIRSTTMQRFNTEEKLRANGDVIVKSKDILSSSAWATYSDKKKLLRLWGGSPSIKQDKSTVMAKEIIYNLETQKIEASVVKGEMPE